MKDLVGERGFEPPTPWSRTRCSTRLSHSPTDDWISVTMGTTWRPELRQYSILQFGDLLARAALLAGMDTDFCAAIAGSDFRKCGVFDGPWLCGLYGAMVVRCHAAAFLGTSDLRNVVSFRRSEIADDASRRVCKGCYNLGHGRLSPLLKRFYAGFYCWKAVHSDGRLRASSRARRAGPHPGNLPSEQPRGTRRSFCVRLRRPRDGARVR